jgi:hypothetical protein
MTTCQWCGDRHGADQLCAKAQRGMTRRSFCFLFGAGIAGVALTPSLDTPNWYRDYNGDLIVYRLGYPTIATFTTKADLPLGRSIAIEFQGQRLFEGKVARFETRRALDPITGRVTQLIDVTALEAAAFEDQRPPRVSAFSPFIQA